MRLQRSPSSPQSPALTPSASAAETARQLLSGGYRQLPKARHGAGARPVQRKARKILLKHVFHSFIISKLLCIVFMRDVHVFVKQHKLVDLVQYIVLVESIFCFYCITVRPAIYLCLRPEIS